MARFLAEIAKGLLLLLGLYALLAAVAFVIFSRESNAYLILGVFLVIAAAMWWPLWRHHLIGWATVGFLVAWIAVAIGLFLIPIEDDIPAEARDLNRAIAARHADRMAYAEELFFALVPLWTSPVRQYLLEPHTVFLIKDFDYFWNRQGAYVDSNIQSQMYRHLLLDSGRFAADEVRLERRSCLNSPHTIVTIRTGGRAVYADLWAADNFDAYRFGMYTTAPCTELRGEPYPGG